MSRLAALYALRARVNDEIEAETRRQDRILALVDEIGPIDEPPDFDPSAPRRDDVYTEEETRMLRNRYMRGWRDEETCAGERQYQRNRKRESRARAEVG